MATNREVEQDNDRLEYLANGMSAHGLRVCSVKRTETLINDSGRRFERTIIVRALGYNPPYRQATASDVMQSVLGGN